MEPLVSAITTHLTMASSLNYTLGYNETRLEPLSSLFSILWEPLYSPRTEEGGQHYA
jgi:hypothetical protein